MELQFGDVSCLMLWRQPRAKVKKAATGISPGTFQSAWHVLNKYTLYGISVWSIFPHGSGGCGAMQLRSHRVPW